MEGIPEGLWATDAGPSENAQDIEIGARPVNNEEEFKLEANRVKLLGTFWTKMHDKISLKVNVAKVQKHTMRTSASQFASVYDIFGIGAATTLPAKLLIQEMHREKLEWDQDVPTRILKYWKKWLDELPIVATLSITRPIIKKDGNRYTDIHVFSDASSFAQGFIVYFVTVYDDGEVDPVFGFAKSVITPINCKANPQRLELDCVLYTCEKLQEVIFDLNIKIRKTFFWSDSIYSLTLINSISTKLSTFEFNRVTKIGVLGSEFIWLHIPGIFNPSDVTSRGEYPKRYKQK